MESTHRHAKDPPHTKLYVKFIYTETCEGPNKHLKPLTFMYFMYFLKWNPCVALK